MLLSMKNGNFYTFLVSEYIFLRALDRGWQERESIEVIEAIDL